MCLGKCKGICATQKENSKNIIPDSRKHVCPMAQFSHLTKLVVSLNDADEEVAGPVIHLDMQTNTIQVDHFTV